jgi:hypothetical protein
MNAVEHVSITIQDDFLERQTRAQPIAALAELIWNSLDSEAGRVDVEFERGDLAGGLSKIVVYDNGEGFPRSEAAKLFGNLGGSWKRLSRRTKTKNRMVHGQEERGRYKALALGRSVTWKVCYLDGERPKAFGIALLDADLNDVAITEERDAPGRVSGVTVEISDVRRDFKVFSSEEGLQELAETFALYLISYEPDLGDPSVSIATHPGCGRRVQFEFGCAAGRRAQHQRMELARDPCHNRGGW